MIFKILFSVASILCKIIIKKYLHGIINTNNTNNNVYFKFMLVYEFEDIGG